MCVSFYLIIRQAVSQHPLCWYLLFLKADWVPWKISWKRKQVWILSGAESHPKAQESFHPSTKASHHQSNYRLTSPPSLLVSIFLVLCLSILFSLSFLSPSFVPHLSLSHTHTHLRARSHPYMLKNASAVLCHLQPERRMQGMLLTRATLLVASSSHKEGSFVPWRRHFIRVGTVAQSVQYSPGEHEAPGSILE